MKLTIRIICLALALLCCLPFVACGNAASDWETIKESGKLVVGITIYDPMNYYDTDQTTLIGFDTEFTQAVCKKLGVEPEFQIIEWTQKESMLKAGNIDAIWNGLTVTEERKEDMGFTKTYLKNRQCIVINKANADKFTDTASLASAILSAEAGSAGEKVIQDNADLKGGLKSVTAQTDALLEVLSGASEAAIVDLTLAKALIK